MPNGASPQPLDPRGRPDAGAFGGSSTPPPGLPGVVSSPLDASGIPEPHASHEQQPDAPGWQPEAQEWQPEAQGRQTDPRAQPTRESGSPRRDDDPGAFFFPDQREDDHRFVPGFGADEHSSDGYNAGDDREAGDRDDSGAGRRGRGRGDSRRPPGPGGDGRPRKRRRFRWMAPLVALLVIVVPLAVGGFYGYSFYMGKYHPADYAGAGTGSVVVQVQQGDDATSLGPKLQRLGVVASARAFVLAAEHSANTAGLLPGFYSMHKHMQATLAYARLLNPADLVEVTITIPEGWRLSQLVNYLGSKSGIPLSAYQKILADPASLHLPSYANGKVEGYLFPATYNVQPHATALGVLDQMTQRFNVEASSINLTQAAKQVHLTPSQVMVMASLVQAEGGRLSDYSKIARVIYNRLAQNIPLQLDSTVMYGLNTFGIIASDKQLTSTSPYNTYKYKGLPPGPIDSPGDAAIQAVLHPAPGNWLYFVTVNPKTGETLFTASQATFEQYRAELQKNIGQG